MLRTLQGIVVRSLKYSESSIIFDLLTSELGLQSFIVGGVFKKNSRHPAGLFQIMSLLEVVAYVKNNDALNRVKEARLFEHYHTIPYDALRRSIGMFMTEVVQKTLRAQEQNELLFQHVKTTFLTLDRSEKTDPSLHLLFMLELSRHLGFFPDGQWSDQACHFNLAQGKFVRSPDGVNTLGVEVSKLFSSCLQAVQAGDSPPRMSREGRRMLLDEIIRFFQYHLDHFREIKTHKVLATILD